MPITDQGFAEPDEGETGGSPQVVTWFDGVPPTTGGEEGRGPLVGQAAKDEGIAVGHVVLLTAGCWLLGGGGDNGIGAGR